MVLMSGKLRNTCSQKNFRTIRLFLGMEDCFSVDSIYSITIECYLIVIFHYFTTIQPT